MEINVHHLLLMTLQKTYRPFSTANYVFKVKLSILLLSNEINYLNFLSLALLLKIEEFNVPVLYGFINIISG